MKWTLAFIIISVLTVSSFSQPIERKIIIQNNSFFYSTIDEEFQLATLHTGKYTDPLKKEKIVAVPAGRNYSEPLNPFSWDLKDSNMYAINFLKHPLNDRNEALKSFHLAHLKGWSDSITSITMIMESIDRHMFAYNDPYRFMLQRSNRIIGFQYDGIVLQDSSYVCVIANNNELSIWNWSDKKKWSHSGWQSFTINGFFTLLEYEKQLYVLLNNGDLHKVSLKNVTAEPYKITKHPLTENTLILNRDLNTYYLIKNKDLNLTEPLEELITKKGISIF